MQIDYCADDFGLTDSVCDHILQCVRNGALNKVSVFPNGPCAHRVKELPCGVTLAMHLNFVEGRSLAFRGKSVLTDENGYFAYDFIGLFRLSLSSERQALAAALKKEFSAQYRAWRDLVGEDTPLVLDSHQHTHMIPLVFRALTEALEEEGLAVRYLRVPAEPITPYLACPSLYVTYGLSGLCKQWLLKFLWLWNRPLLRKKGIATAFFCGILFSGRMDEKRVRKVLPRYRRLAERKGRNLEFLFHPGSVSESDPALRDGSVRFARFYTSSGRKTEAEALYRLKS